MAHERDILALVGSELEIDTNGRIWRTAEFRWRQLVSIPRRRAEYAASTGYLMLKVTVDGRRVATSAHRLVFTHLHGPIPTGTQINHKNGVKTDNRPANLEIVTAQENSLHAWAFGLQRKQVGENNSNAKITAAGVLALRRMVAAGVLQRIVAARFGISQPTVSEIVNRKNWGHL